MEKQKMIRDYIVRQFLPAKSELTFDEPLFTSGAIDSLGVLELIAFLEREFGIVIDTQSHELIEFNTVHSVASLVDKLSKSHAG
jgi:acyl carrier protein